MKKKVTLTLSRETVAHLENAKLGLAQGGLRPTVVCASDIVTCTQYDC